ncbi:MAG: YdeI/OmpD-associated family protein [Caulobacterales bacterium]|nr:YdeI/OmpD-associated family protein [Caulobacterales bacterium]MCA0372207.1 YdeI/OmpD-associated family protein [Pseudomonadota bacterium]
MNSKIEEYFNKPRKWQNEERKLREIALTCGLDEEYKWMHPCYTLNGANIVLIHGFKEYCALLFMKGALLKDEQGILIRQTENVQAARQIRFTSLEEIIRQGNAIKTYIMEAIEIEKSGAKVEMSKSTNLEYPEEFQSALDSNPDLAKAFEALTQGRKRGYNLYFTSAKQSATRTARVEKCIPKILAGKGLDD